MRLSEGAEPATALSRAFSMRAIRAYPQSGATPRNAPRPVKHSHIAIAHAKANHRIKFTAGSSALSGSVIVILQGKRYAALV